VIFGMISASSMSADPHAGQKRRYEVAPERGTAGAAS